MHRKNESCSGSWRKRETMLLITVGQGCQTQAGSRPWSPAIQTLVMPQGLSKHKWGMTRWTSLAGSAQDCAARGDAYSTDFRPGRGGAMLNMVLTPARLPHAAPAPRPTLCAASTLDSLDLPVPASTMCHGSTLAGVGAMCSTVPREGASRNAVQPGRHCVQCSKHSDQFGICTT